MALVPEGYPNRKLDDDEVGVSRKLIRGHILGLPESPYNTGPTFTGTWVRDGTIVFGCTNQESV